MMTTNIVLRMNCTKNILQPSIFINLEKHKTMDRNFIEQHQNDPAWAEVMRLYSGLFDTLEERNSFIINLSDTNILLSAECKSSSIEKQDDLQHILSKKGGISIKRP